MKKDVFFINSFEREEKNVSNERKLIVLIDLSSDWMKTIKISHATVFVVRCFIG